MAANNAAELKPSRATISKHNVVPAVSVDSIGAVQDDVQRRLRAVQYMQAVLSKSSNSFCSLELSPLLQMRKRPLEEMKQQCKVLAEYGAKNNLW